MRISGSEGIRAELYTMRTDSWREIDMKNLGDIHASACQMLCWREFVTDWRLNNAQIRARSLVLICAMRSFIQCQVHLTLICL